MRASEWINVLAFSFFAVVSRIRSLPRQRRAVILVLCASGIGSVVAVQLIRHVVSPLTASVIRDWLPAPLILLAYWAAGQFFIEPNERFQARLLKIDDRVRGSFQRWLRIPGALRKFLLAGFEVAYALCYALVPLGVAVLYFARMGRYADRFWMTVLPPTYLCYSALPFIQTLPPRTVEPKPSEPANAGSVRRMNLWIVRHASIQVNTFPSGHVAASLAVALALVPLVPAMGWVFLLIAGGIAAGAFLGRYHYAADLVLAAIIALLTFFIESALFW